MRGYKAFNRDLTCRDKQYEIGKEYVFDGEPILCFQGFHFCESIVDCYGYYQMNDNTRICEVEATGDIKKDGTKYVTNKIKILAEITNENLRKGNTGTYNSGYFNTGTCNSGLCNTGTGNSDSYNSGNCNSGSFNSGGGNSGDRNSGDRNNGDWNSGDFNNGDWNSGDRNRGNRNSGEWNSGNRSSGVFNTEKEPTIKMFDKDSPWTFKDWYLSRARSIMEGCPQSYSNFIEDYEMTRKGKENHPEYKTIGGFVETIKATKEIRQEWWDKLSENSKNIIKALPNFDEKKFCECVGIEHI
ncbi:MAG: hypothetical protein LIR46_07715 [Bacteroidota bacterium]|nr:hypothetical protein [Bacteroidota bacterium]